jgi:hypothetical protein
VSGVIILDAVKLAQALQIQEGAVQGVYIKYKQGIKGTVTVPDLNTEVTVVEINPQENDYIIEGYIDVSQMQVGDTLEVREYIAVDGTNYSVYAYGVFSDAQDQPVIRFTKKTLQAEMKYKVTVRQTTGTPRSFPYCFILLVYGQA